MLQNKQKYKVSVVYLEYLEETKNKSQYDSELRVSEEIVDTAIRLSIEENGNTNDVGTQTPGLLQILRAYEQVLLKYDIKPEQDIFYYRFLLRLNMDPEKNWKLKFQKSGLLCLYRQQLLENPNTSLLEITTANMNVYSPSQNSAHHEKKQSIMTEVTAERDEALVLMSPKQISDGVCMCRREGREKYVFTFFFLLIVYASSEWSLSVSPPNEPQTHSMKKEAADNVHLQVMKEAIGAGMTNTKMKTMANIKTKTKTKKKKQRSTSVRATKEMKSGGEDVEEMSFHPVSRSLGPFASTSQPIFDKHTGKTKLYDRSSSVFVCGKDRDFDVYTGNDENNFVSMLEQ
ncbi:hypothetical protein RFI_34021, partial [Reticulomyxa filosa]